MAGVKAYQKWYDEQESKLGPQLSEGTYSIPLDPGNHIPASIFQHASVQAKLKAMRENESLEASNRRRIPVPEDHPYFKQETMIPYLYSFAHQFEIEEDKYDIVLLDNQPHAVFYKSMKPRLDTGGEFKIHLMFNIKYIRNVLTLLFQRLIKPNTIPVLFKLLNYNTINAIPGRAGTPTPQFNDARAHHYSYGVNNSEKQKYGRLAESFIYSPTEIKKYPVSYRGSPTFKLTARTRKNKEILNETYDFEALFDPVIVFYTRDSFYTMMLLQELLTIFPDESTQDWVLPNYYPRANVKINNMIYIGSGDYSAKYGKPKCTVDESGPKCILNEYDRLLDIPAEYEEIQSSCSEKQEKGQCDTANRFPLAVSNHKLCKWEEEKCQPKKTFSQHLILGRFDSVEDLYKELGQTAVLDKFKAGTANASLPVNYNGGRRKKRRITKKAHRTHRRSSRKN
jgi:hypothetical protein